MICPNCNAGPEHIQVPDSRHVAEDKIRRRRVCLKCNERFTTLEVVVQSGKHLRQLRVTVSPKDATVVVLPRGATYYSSDTA